MRTIGRSSHLISRVEDILAMAAITHTVIYDERQDNFTRSVPTIRNVLRPALAYHAIATDPISEIGAMVAAMSNRTPSLLATMISSGQAQTGRKREWWLPLRAIQKSDSVIKSTNSFVCAQANIPWQ
jgi:hypothetical protein